MRGKGKREREGGRVEQIETDNQKDYKEKERALFRFLPFPVIYVIFLLFVT